MYPNHDRLHALAYLRQLRQVFNRKAEKAGIELELRVYGSNRAPDEKRWIAFYDLGPERRDLFDRVGRFVLESVAHIASPTVPAQGMEMFVQYRP